MTGIALLLVALGAALLVAALATVALAPVMASRAAAVASRPQLDKLGRRASGDDRMRALISAQLNERKQTRGLSGTLTRSGVLLGVLSLVSLIGGAVAWAMGF
jgi:hypothetical protein